MFERYFVKTRNLQFTLSYLNMHIGADIDRYRVSTKYKQLNLFYRNSTAMSNTSNSLMV